MGRDFDSDDENQEENLDSLMNKIGYKSLFIFTIILVQYCSRHSDSRQNTREARRVASGVGIGEISFRVAPPLSERLEQAKYEDAVA